MRAVRLPRYVSTRQGPQSKRHRVVRELWVLALLATGLPLAVPGERMPRLAEAAATVGLWDRFEVAVTNAKPYADPYADVALDATYTRPDGSQVAFGGFYDGGTTWKIRFMPDQLGTWRYQAFFSDGQPGASDAFTVVGSDLPGMLSSDPSNPMWFGFKGGGHILIRSLHVGDRFFAANWAASDRAAFLDWAQAQGYNTLSIASHYLNRNANGRGVGWDTPDLWPLNAAEYQEMEAVLDDLSDRHIMVYPFAGFFGRASDFPRNSADQSRYIRYSLARLGSYWNVMLNVAGPEPNLDGYLSGGEVSRLGAEIDAMDVFSHPLTVHNRPGDDPYRDSSWTSFGTLQGPNTTDPATMSSFLLRNHHPAKPLYAQESLWSGNQNQPAYSDTDLRKLAFVVNMSAAALNFGDMAGTSSSGFSGTLDLSQRNQARHDIVKRVWDYFETVPFYRMKPCQSSVSVGFCLGEAGRQYLVYLPSIQTVDVNLPGGSYAIDWINAQDTSDIRSGGTTPDGRSLSPPNAGDDWILQLTAGEGAGATPTTATDPAGETITLRPVADTYVQDTAPERNFGSATSIKVDGSPVQIGYVRFDLSPLRGQNVAAATLTLAVTNGSSRTQAFRYTDDAWTEKGLTYANRPPSGTAFASNGGGAGPVREITVTAAVLAEQGELLSFAVENDGDDSFDFASRESALAPELVVTLAASSPAPTPTLVSTPAPAATASVVGFTLVDADADADADIGPLVDGATIDLATLPTRNLNVRADTAPASVGSVVFGHDGVAPYRIENTAPYTLAGDLGGDIYPWTPGVGRHNLIATPYAERDGGGNGGTTLTIRFTVVDSAQPVPSPTPTVTVTTPAVETPAPTTEPSQTAAPTDTPPTAPTVPPASTETPPPTDTPLPTPAPVVVRFVLVNADTGQDLGPLADEATIDLATLPTRNLNVRADTDPATVGSVVFGYDESAVYRIENRGPYMLAGNELGGPYFEWTPTSGTHGLSATAYTERNGAGAAGPPNAITFTVVDEPVAVTTLGLVEDPVEDPAPVDAFGPILFRDGIVGGDPRQWSQAQAFTVRGRRGGGELCRPRRQQR